MSIQTIGKAGGQSGALKFEPGWEYFTCDVRRSSAANGYLIGDSGFAPFKLPSSGSNRAWEGQFEFSWYHSENRGVQGPVEGAITYRGANVVLANYTYGGSTCFREIITRSRFLSDSSAISGNTNNLLLRQSDGQGNSPCARPPFYNGLGIKGTFRIRGGVTVSSTSSIWNRRYIVKKLN